MNEFQRRNFKLPSNRVSPVSNKEKTDNRFSATKSLLRETQNHISIIKRSDGVFRLIFFFKSTESDLFVQRISNDDVQATNRHTLLARSISSVLFRTRKDWQVERRLHSFLRKQFAGHLRPSAGSRKLQSIKSNFQPLSDRLSKLQRATQVL